MILVEVWPEDGPLAILSVRRGVEQVRWVAKREVVLRDEENEGVERQDGCGARAAKRKGGGRTHRVEVEDFREGGLEDRDSFDLYRHTQTHKSFERDQSQRVHPERADGMRASDSRKFFHTPISLFAP